MTVYAIRAHETNLYKIGYTSGDVAKRLGQLQTGCPHSLEIYRILKSANRDIEKTILEGLSDFKTDGGEEWYDIDEDTLNKTLDISENSKDNKNDKELEFHKWIYEEPSDEDIENEIARCMYRQQGFEKAAQNVGRENQGPMKEIVIELTSEQEDMINSFAGTEQIPPHLALSKIVLQGLSTTYIKRINYLFEIMKLRDFVKDTRKRNRKSL